MGTQGFGLPDLPPEWGEVVIPDDPAELDAEADIIRRELRREGKHARRAARMQRFRRRFHLPDKIDNPDEPSLALPLIVLAIAVLITILGLLIVAWPGLTQPREPQPSAPVTPASSAATTEVGFPVTPLTPGGSA
jgi:hypothetical protein